MAEFGWKELKMFAKFFNPLLTIGVASWLISSFHLSFMWVVLFICLYCWKLTFAQTKANRLATAQSFFKDEKQAIHDAFDEVPRWVFFPDIERVEWLNKVAAPLWSNISHYVRKYLKDTLEIMIQQSLPSRFKSFCFDLIDLGDLPPRFGGVKVYNHQVSRNEIVLDADFYYAGDAFVSVKMAKLVAGIKDLQIRGTLRIVFTPLINKPPFLGGLKLYFVSNPSINFNLTSIANIFDAPGLYELLRGALIKQLSLLMVLPNMITIPLSESVDESQLQMTIPQGVLRIRLVKAEGLRCSDAMSKSDSYAMIYVGANVFTSTVKKNTANPVWDEYFECPVIDGYGQCIEILVFDKDDTSKDDELGSVTLRLKDVIEEGFLDTWLCLEGGSGSLKLQFTWFLLSNERSKLAEFDDVGALIPMLQSIETNEHLTSSLVSVSVFSATNLESVKNFLSEPSSVIIMSVGHTEQRGKPVLNSNNPKYADTFHFVVRSPHLESISVKIEDPKSKEKLGSLNVNIRSILEAPGMTVSRPYSIREHGGKSEVYMCISTHIYVPAKRQADTVHSSPVRAANVAPASETIPLLDANNHSSVADNADLEPIQPVFSLGRTSSIDSMKSQTSELRRRAAALLNEDPVGQDAGLGQIQLTIRYSSVRKKLVLVVHKCLNLISCDEDKTSDPYVRVYLLPDRSLYGKKKTQTHKNDLNPVFDETFEFNVSTEDCQFRTMEIAVKNQHSIFSKERSHIGEVIVPLSEIDFSQANTYWYYLQPEEDLDSSVAND